MAVGYPYRIKGQPEKDILLGKLAVKPRHTVMLPIAGLSGGHGFLNLLVDSCTIQLTKGQCLDILHRQRLLDIGTESLQNRLIIPLDHQEHRILPCLQQSILTHPLRQSLALATCQQCQGQQQSHSGAKYFLHGISSLRQKIKPSPTT